VRYLGYPLRPLSKYDSTCSGTECVSAALRVSPAMTVMPSHVHRPCLPLGLAGSGGPSVVCALAVVPLATGLMCAPNFISSRRHRHFPAPVAPSVPTGHPLGSLARVGVDQELQDMFTHGGSQ
jgi:hypothetical protein